MKKKMIVVFALALAIAVVSHNGYLFAQTQNAATSAVAQETGNAGTDNPVFTNVVETGFMQIEPGKEPQNVRVYSNRPNNSTGSLGTRFYYSQVPVLKLSEDFYDAESGTVGFDINLLSYNKANPVRIKEEAELRKSLTDQYPELSGNFALVPLDIVEHQLFLQGSSGESEVIPSMSGGGRVGSNTMLFSGTIKSESIRNELETAPQRVGVSLLISHPFRVLDIQSFDVTVSTTLIDDAIEEATGIKPEGSNDMFVSRKIHSDIARRIHSKASFLFPIGMSEQLQKKWDEVGDGLMKMPPITEEDFASISSQNIVITPGMIAKDLSPTVIQRITTALKESESYKSYIEKVAKDIKDIATKDETHEKFYNELQKTWKRSGGTSGGGSVGIGIGPISIGGSAKASGNFSTEGTYASKDDNEKKAIAEFQQKIASEDISIEDISRAISKEWTGTEQIDEVRAKDFELVRVNKTSFARAINVFIGEFKELPRANISRRYDFRLREVIYVDPPIATGTIVTWWGKEDASKPNNGAPSGYLFCNGAPVPEGTQYQALREHLKSQTPELTQEGTLTPDLRGMFLRGINGIRPGELGSTQNASYQSHAHGITADGGHTPTMQTAGAHQHPIVGPPSSDYVKNNNAVEYMWTHQRPREATGPGRPKYRYEGYAADTARSNGAIDVLAIQGAHTHTLNAVPAHAHGGATQVAGGGGSKEIDTPNETRPVNVGVNYIIKY